jgi:hypothetical protein
MMNIDELAKIAFDSYYREDGIIDIDDIADDIHDLMNNRNEGDIWPFVETMNDDDIIESFIERFANDDELQNLAIAIHKLMEA